MTEMKPGWNPVPVTRQQTMNTITSTKQQLR